MSATMEYRVAISSMDPAQQKLEAELASAMEGEAVSEKETPQEMVHEMDEEMEHALGRSMMRHVGLFKGATRERALVEEAFEQIKKLKKCPNSLVNVNRFLKQRVGKDILQLIAAFDFSAVTPEEMARHFSAWDVQLCGRSKSRELDAIELVVHSELIEFVDATAIEKFRPHWKRKWLFLVNFFSDMLLFVGPILLLTQITDATVLDIYVGNTAWGILLFYSCMVCIRTFIRVARHGLSLSTIVNLHVWTIGIALTSNFFGIVSFSIFLYGTPVCTVTFVINCLVSAFTMLPSALTGYARSLDHENIIFVISSLVPVGGNYLKGLETGLYVERLESVAYFVFIAFYTFFPLVVLRCSGPLTK